MRILLCGDFHGNTSHAVLMGRVAKRYDCAGIVQLGDFGYWPRQMPGYLDKVSRNVEVPIYWIDGNHEDFHALYDVTKWAKPTSRGFVEVGTDVYYIPRGTQWTWCNTTFVGCGGAYSIDRHHRTLGHSYFNEELISQQDFAKAVSHDKCDVLLTHDSPYHATLHDEFKDDPNTETNRWAVQGMIDQYHPEYLFHAHYHFYYQQRMGKTLVTGLDMDERPKSYVVFNVVTREIEC